MYRFEVFSNEAWFFWYPISGENSEEIMTKSCGNAASWFVAINVCVTTPSADDETNWGTIPVKPSGSLERYMLILEWKLRIRICRQVPMSWCQLPEEYVSTQFELAPQIKGTAAGMTLIVYRVSDWINSTLSIRDPILLPLKALPGRFERWSRFWYQLTSISLSIWSHSIGCHNRSFCSDNIALVNGHGTLVSLLTNGPDGLESFRQSLEGMTSMTNDIWAQKLTLICELASYVGAENWFDDLKFIPTILSVSICKKKIQAQEKCWRS